MNSPINVNIKCLYAAQDMPEFTAPSNNSFDIRASLNRPERLGAGHVRAIPTGLAFDIPEGYGLFLSSRAGLAKRHEIFVINATGLIEQDYKDEVFIILKNASDEPFFVNPGAKIAHAWIGPVTKVNFKVTKND